jgi:acid phosphatase (class A)
MRFSWKADRAAQAILCAGMLVAHGFGAFAKESVLALTYLKPGQPDAATLLAPPPAAGSPEQAADLAEVIAVHNSCTSNEAALATEEKHFSILNFTNAIGPSFQPGNFPKVETFIGRVQTNAQIAVDAAKFIWKRPRPYTLEPSLAGGKLETSFSYPSGHSTEATAVALVLAELFPKRREAILKVSRDIGWHRVLIGRHYLTDIYAGRVFAQAIVREMKSNPDFQRDFAEARKELQAQ